MHAHFRKVTIMMLSLRHWRKRLVFWLGAVLVGVVASCFALLVDKTQAFFDAWIAPHIWLPLLISPPLFAASAWLTRQFFPAARGSGIPQVIAARILRHTESRRELLGVKIAIAKMLLTTLGVLAGASIGREGPTVQIGAAIMLWCATYGGIGRQRGVVLAGAAAGVAAAFNTPLAGIVFAIEEMARAFESRNSSIVLIAIVFAGTAAMSILGNYNYFGYTNASINFIHDWQPILAIALLGGLLGGLFARIMIDGEGILRRCFNGFGIRRPIVFAAACGGGVAFIGLITGGMTYGSGYELGHALLHQELTASWWHLPAKFLSTALSAVSGIPGGIFSPSLSVGAALGADISGWFPSLSVQGAVLLGMVAYFAGVTQAPITAFVIVLEVTGKATTAVPLIATATLAAAVGRLVCNGSLYHTLAKSFLMPSDRPQSKLLP